MSALRLLVAALFIPLWAGNLVFGSAPEAVAEFEKSAEKSELLRASKAFQEGIRPHLRPTSDVAESREDGTKRRHDLPTRVRGTVWVYLRQ